MVIDLENFQDISVDENGVATIGAGVRLGNLALGIYNQSQRALPHGTCPGVGIGGHFTHGGYGYDSRKWGLALDTIVALDVVLANGTLIKATSTVHPDIYYVSVSRHLYRVEASIYYIIYHTEPISSEINTDLLFSGTAGSCRILWDCDTISPANETCSE